MAANQYTGVRQENSKSAKWWRDAKADPEKHAKVLAYQRAYSAKRRADIKLDPVRYAEHRKKHRKWSSRYREKYPEKDLNLYRAARELIVSLKMESGCVDCGYKGHPAALDFDHVRGKKVGCVSLMRSREAILSEAAKCVIRCANCHRIKTSMERRERGT